MGNKTSTNNTNLVNYTVFYNRKPDGSLSEQAGEVKTSDILILHKENNGYKVLLYNGTTVNIKATHYDRENRKFDCKDIDPGEKEEKLKEILKYLKKLAEK